MIRTMTASVLFLLCTACGGTEEGTARTVAPENGVGPVREGTIVEMPMDSLTNQEMEEENGAMADQEIVVSER